MKKLKLLALALISTMSLSTFAADYSSLNYDGGSDLPAGFKYYGSSSNTENKSAFSVIEYENRNMFDVTAGGTGAYNKRAIEFTLTEDVNVSFELYAGNTNRDFVIYQGSTELTKTNLAATKTLYTFSYDLKGATIDAPITYSFSGSGSKVYIAKMTFTPLTTVECTEADATFAATATNLSIEAGQTEATTTLTFTKGLNTSDATFAVLKDGKATEDATVAGNVFTATAAGEYIVKATQEFDETYCQVVKEVVITVTDNRPAPVTIFEWEKKGSNGFSEDNTDLSVDTQGTLTIGTSVVGRKFGGNNVDNNSKGYKLGNNDVCIEIQGTSDFEIGDIVTITGVGGGSGERGFSIAPVTTTDAKTDVENTNLIDDSSNKKEYTVVVTGKQAGEKLRIFRLDSKTMYLYGIKVVRPADDGVAKLAVNPESVDLNVTAVESNPTATVRFSGKNLTPNTYNLVVPQVAGLTVTPSQVVVGEDGKLNAEVVLAYTSTVDVAATVAELSLTIDNLNAKVAINYSAELAKEYATSLNIEQLVLDNGKGYDIKAALDAANIEYSSIDALDSLDDADGKTARNYAFMGLKLKTSGATIGLWLKQGSTLKVRLGNMGANVKVSGAGEEETLTADKYANIDNDADNKVYTYTAADADAYVLFTTTGSGTVVFKQIMIDEDIAAVTLPAKPGTGTALDNTAAAQKAHKIVRDGQLLIIRDGKTYTAQGVELK